MKIDYYEEFVILADTGSFSRAAEQLPFSQAALTQHVQQMEESYGAKLFDRSTRRVELSEYGKLVLPHAQRIVKLRQDALSAVRAQLMHEHYDISIGYFPAAGRYDAPDKVQIFQSQHPELNLKCRELLPEVLTEALRQGEFDFAILEERDEEHDDGYDRLRLNRDKLAAVLPVSHPLASYGAALLAQLAKEQFYLLPEHTFVNRLATEACKEAGFTPTVTYTSFSLKKILDMIAKSSGVSLLMTSPAEKLKQEGVVVVDLIPGVTSSVNLLFRSDSLDENGRMFLDFMATQREL